MTSIKTRYLVVLVLAAGFLVATEPDLHGRRSGLALPELHRQVAALRQAGKVGAAGLGDRLLEVVTVDPGQRAEVAERILRAPEAPNGAVQQAWEADLAEALRALPPAERWLLWSLTLEPRVAEGLRAQMLRLLDQGESSPRQLAEAVERGEGAPAWEAAVRLGRRGGAHQTALRGAVSRWRGWGRQYAVLGLVLAGDREAMPWIRGAVSDTSNSVRRHVALAIGELGQPADRGLLDHIARRQPDAATLRAVLHAKGRLAERYPEPS